MAAGGDLIGRSVLELTTDNRKLKRGIKQGRREAQRLDKSFSTVKANIAGIFAGIGVAFATRQLVEYSDAWLSITNQLKIVTNSTEELVLVQSKLFDIAQETRAPIDATAKLYSRLAIAAEDLGASQQELLDFTRGVGQALAVTNTSVQESRGSLIQLSQAMGSGIVRGEEFNSILEGTPRIARAVAAGLGLTVAKLRALVIAGKVTSREFFEAFQSQLPVLAAEFARTRISIGQSLTIMNNALTRFVGKADETSEASKLIGESIQSLAKGIGDNTAGIIARMDAMAVGIKTAVEGITENLFLVGTAVAALARRDFPAMREALAQLKPAFKIGTDAATAAAEAFEKTRLKLKALKEEGQFDPATGAGQGDPTIDDEALAKRAAAIELIRMQLEQLPSSWTRPLLPFPFPTS